MDAEIPELGHGAESTYSVVYRTFESISVKEKPA